MDLLGSILGSMNGPPPKVLSEKDKERRRKEKALEEKRKAELEKFRSEIEKAIKDFVNDSPDKSKTFGPMDGCHRSVLRDVADMGGLVSHSFGEEDKDRHVVIWKKEFSPCEEELQCLRKGEVYDPEEIKMKKEVIRLQEEEEEKRARSNKSKNPPPPPPPKAHYLNKFEHLIGSQNPEAVNANKSYGMVSAESKKDKRTVEEVQAELRAKKRAKLSH